MSTPPAPANPAPSARGVWLGRRRYAEVLRLQEELMEARKRGSVPDTVLFVEHEPVITMGRGTKAGHLLATEPQLAELGVELHATGRGGDVTVHAPGQLVCYPILQLEPGERDVRRYVKSLNRVMARVAAGWGVQAGEFPDLVGLWADRRNIALWPDDPRAAEPVKVGAIGVRISRWVTMHGFALNLTTDLRWFNLVVPCGIREHGVTTLLELTGKNPSVRTEASVAFAALCEILGRKPLELVEHTPDRAGTLSVAALR